MRKSLFLATAFVCACAALPAQTAGEKLQYVVIMSRHGVRTPLQTNEVLDQYSAEPWPKWHVPLGYLTEHGRTLMEYMGDYYREYLTKASLLPATGCASAQKFYFWSDTDERDIETGKAIAEHMFRSCKVPVYAMPPGKVDPLFNSVKAVVGKTDPELAATSMLKRMDGSPQAVTEKHRAQLDRMQKILLPTEVPGRKLFENVPASVKPTAGALAAFSGPLTQGSSFADDFLLEYTEGLKASEIGWGRVSKATVTELLQIQAEYMDMTLRTPYLARTAGSNLMSHMLKSMQQFATKQPIAGALGKPGDQGVVLLGHDSNESNLSGMLNITWKTEDYPLNGRPPGSSLVFEMWKNKAGKYSVRTYFLTQTLDQMHDAVPLSLKTPPVKVPIEFPGCERLACDWDKFQSIVEADIDPAFVSNKPLDQTAK